MDFEFSKLIVPALLGLLAGAIGLFIMPWIHRRIEAKRKSLDYKRSLIKEARQLIDDSISLEQILSSSLWGFISANLSKDEKRSVTDTRRTELLVSHGVNALARKKQTLSEMLNRLEREWNL